MGDLEKVRYEECFAVSCHKSFALFSSQFLCVYQMSLFRAWILTICAIAVIFEIVGGQ